MAQHRGLLPHLGKTWALIIVLRGCHDDGNYNTKLCYGIFISVGFSVFLGWLPVGGWGEDWKQRILPIIVLALPQIAYISRTMRGSMVEALRSNYIKNGKSERLVFENIVVKHCLRAAMPLIISYLGSATAAVITGSVVVGQIFGITGVGRYFVQGSLNRDYTLVMGIVVFYGVLIVLFNLLVDIIYSLLDPKVRL